MLNAPSPSVFGTASRYRRQAEGHGISTLMDLSGLWPNNMFRFNRNPNFNNNIPFQNSINNRLPAMNGGDAFALEAIMDLMDREIN